MIDNKIKHTIYSHLSEYISENNVGFYPSNNLLKYVINIKQYFIEISYYFTDDFYRIKIENRKHTQLQNVIFLTQSKQFHQDVRKNLRINKLAKKSFENHMICFVNILREVLNNDSPYLENFYEPNLKFDGIFI